jgi:serine/threonine-protein kinase
VSYVSSESGRSEIYVRAFPGPGGKWQISTDGGLGAVWARNGRELFYLSGDKIMAVDVNQSRDSNGAVASGFSAGTPRLLFEGVYEKQAGAGANYDVSPDGQRFLMIKGSGTQTALTQLNVVLEWFEELKGRVPVK